MENEVVGPSGRQVQQDSTTVVSGQRLPPGQRFHNNVSVQTGEEFYMEGLQDRASARRVLNLSDIDQAQLKRGRFIINQNSNVEYEDLTGILGLQRMNSECSYDASDAALRKGYVREVENRATSNQVSRYYENGLEAKESKVLYAEMNNYRPVSGIVAQHGPVLDSPHARAPYGSGISDGRKPGKIKFLCSFGGKILPRPSDAKLRYVGGETRIINIRNNLSWAELVKKTSEICNQPHTIKYQLPGEDLDALISVSSDEDLQNMLEEYNGLERVDGQRLRLFLISANESESPSSFEARAAEQSSSEYQYVVAVNGVVDPSPRKSFGGPVGQNWDHNSNFHRDSPTAMHLLETSPSNIMTMFPRPAANFFTTSQNTFKSPNQSPPYSPLPIQRRDSKGSHLYLGEDQSCQGSNESSSSLITDQPRQDNYVIEGTGYFNPTPGGVPLNYQHHPRKSIVDVEKQSKSRGVHFQDRKQIREFGNPHAINRNNSDMDNYTCEKPVLKERAFHSEKIVSQADDSMGLLSGSDESVSSHLGMPHVLSDSWLQEHGEKFIRSSQEGNTPLSPLDFSTKASLALSNSSAWRRGPVKVEKNTESPNPENSRKLPNSDSINSPRKLGVPKFAHFPKFTGREERTHVGDFEEKIQETGEVSNLMPLGNYSEQPEMRLDMLNLMDENDSLLPHEGGHHDSSNSGKLPSIKEHQVSVIGAYSNFKHNVPRTIIPASSLSEDKREGYQLDTSKSELLVRSQRTLKGDNFISSDRVQGGLGHEKDNILSCISSVSCSQNFEVAESNMMPLHTAKWFNDETYHIDPGCGLVTDASCASSWQQAVLSQKEKDDEETMLVSSGPKLHIRRHNDLLSWSSFQKANADASSRRDVYLLDNESGMYADQKVDKVDIRGHPPESSRVGNSTAVGSELVDSFGSKIQLESVIVEDVTDSMPLDFESSSKVVPHVDEDIPSPRLTDAGIISSQSECEDSHGDDGDRNESISDSSIAEMEAGIYGLQIIRNADLEEFRELGSGTFGTVYHGKWRGTDVAIKRIKKSCFSGRSSEQERLTKDFWREAQILSKLHHPNVVAFYGVVPDGSGGTLATVTEFMVNGSLRHVLLRKDRALDRRKKLIIAMDAAFGMEYLHSKNIVHFDLKCDNLLVNLRDSQRPICKVGDFGLSRIKRNTLVSGGVRGTLPWMAPELLSGSSNRVSEKVDVFSFGIAMWEILTGEEPYANMHCGAIIGGIVNNSLRPPIPDRCDPEWKKLMEECWTPDPSVRPSFTEITNRLRVMSMALQARGQPQAKR